MQRRLPLRRFPWIRPLVSTYAEEFASVAELFAGDPSTPEAWKDAIARVTRAPRDRGRLVSVLERQQARRRAPAAALEAARTLADPRAVAIVTGQQAGLFGGPLYTVLKAVTAMQLARRVEQQHGTPAVPVFWVDAEDHDWDEVKSASVLDRSFAPRDVVMGDLPGAGSLPVARLTLDEAVGDALAELGEVLPETEFTAEVMAALARHYRPGVGYGAAFAGWIDELLGRHGLVVFEADDAEAKPLVAALFQEELNHPGRTAKLARAAGNRMAALGHAPQVEPAEDAVALFYLGAEDRVPVRRTGGGFSIGERQWTAEDLRREAEQHPERFSPNVLLRPLVQDRLFPTVCYVAGPSELAYQAQLKDVYGSFGVEPPLLYSRASATLLDSGAMRFLGRHGMPFEDLHKPDDSALNHLLDRLLPAPLERALEDTTSQTAVQAATLRREVRALDPTLEGAVDTTLERMQTALKTLHAKIIHSAKKKDEALRRQFERTRTLAFPAGHPQERLLGVVFFANRYGPALVDRLLADLPLETDAHSLVVL